MRSADHPTWKGCVRIPMFRHICVVEDDADILELLEFNLKRKGYEVTTYNDGTEAYEGISNILPDLVILDLTLPGLTGMEICKYLRNNKRTSHIPIIILIRVRWLFNMENLST